MPTINIYRVITENGYVEFKTQQEAEIFATANNLVTIEQDIRELPEIK